MPTRRRLALIVAVVVVTALGFGVALAAAAGRTSRTTGGRAAAPVAQDRPGPVLLVPGYGGNGRAFDQVAARLHAAGRQTQVVTLPGTGTGDLGEQARALGRAARSAMARSHAESVDVVGYSAGGVVARLWVRAYGGAALTRRVVTLGSPHHGTRLVAPAAASQAGSCPPACRQLAPGSALLQALNRGDETPPGPRWVSVWSSDDQVVTPPDSARLTGAVNIVLQDVCPGERVEHNQLPISPLVEAIVLLELAATPVVVPHQGDCARLH